MNVCVSRCVSSGSGCGAVEQAIAIATDADRLHRTPSSLVGPQYWIVRSLRDFRSSSVAESSHRPRYSGDEYRRPAESWNGRVNGLIDDLFVLSLSQQQ